MTRRAALAGGCAAKDAAGDAACERVHRIIRWDGAIRRAKNSRNYSTASAYGEAALSGQDVGQARKLRQVEGLGAPGRIDPGLPKGGPAVDAAQSGE